MLTKLGIERHAASIYTNTIFKEVQEQIKASIMGCVLSKMYSEGEDNIYLVGDNLDGIFTVRNVQHEDYLSCSCKLFIKKGILYKHIILVMRNSNVKNIPEKYIFNRWCKFSRLSLPKDHLEENDVVSRNSLSVNYRFFKVASDCIGHVRGNEEMTERCLSELEAISQKYAKKGNSDSSSNTREALFQEFYGSVPPDEPSVLPPSVVKTKGSGAGGRRKSNQEKVMILAQKPTRNCRICNTKGHHDSRNCPFKNVSNP